MNEVNEASPANKVSDIERVVICRTCDGKGSHSPEYGEAIALIQATWDAGNVDTLINDAMNVMKIKKSKRPHIKLLLETFCRMVDRFDGI